MCLLGGLWQRKNSRLYIHLCLEPFDSRTQRSVRFLGLSISYEDTQSTLELVPGLLRCPKNTVGYLSAHKQQDLGWGGKIQSSSPTEVLPFLQE